MVDYIYDQPELTGGMDDILVDTVTAVPTFTVGLLLFVFGVILLGGMAAQKRRTGYSDAPQWSLMASIGTLLVSLILTLKEGLINLETLGVVVAVTIFTGLWFFMSKGRGEI